MSSSIPNNIIGQDNIYADIPAQLADELTSILTSSSNIRIERIVSQGHKSKQGFWYDQDEHEWLTVLQGAATLQFDEPDSELKLAVGDYTLISAHRKHRVSWTSQSEQTIWLAIFFQHDNSSDNDNGSNKKGL